MVVVAALIDDWMLPPGRERPFSKRLHTSSHHSKSQTKSNPGVSQVIQGADLSSAPIPQSWLERIEQRAVRPGGTGTKVEPGLHRLAGDRKKFRFTYGRERKNLHHKTIQK